MSSGIEVPDRNKLRKDYDQISILHERLAQEVRFILRERIQGGKIKIQGISSRIKSFDSLYDKIVRKEMTDVKLKDMTDIAGVRVVCLLRSDLDKIGKMIHQNFEVLHTDTIRTRSPTQFGYMSDQYIIKLPDSFVGTRYDRIKQLKCEIQVRTILMDAWASVSHYLDYKKEIEIPLELRKDFNAISGLLYAADTHFELFKGGVEKARRQLLRSIKEEVFDLGQEMNLDTLEAYLKMKYRDRKHSTRSSISELIKDLKAVDYLNLRKLDQALNRSKIAFEKYEEEIETKGKFTDVGIVRISLGICNLEFRELKYKKTLDKNMAKYEHLLD